ncbi:hypothetical protein QE152_g34167 [Popillia japonica]|uniref:Uncharacterized protein n=1 Tax=Popillia japonica TaxID=7064 RepID=A0AAW1IUH1_POPJA
MDLDKSMAHAISLLQRRPTKSIIANKSVNKTLLETSEVRESLKGHDPMIRPYFIGLMTDETDEFDEKYGIREEGGRLYRLQVNGSWAGGIYSEFEGNVVKIVFSNDTTQIRIANTIFGKEDLQTFSPFTLKKGDELSLKYSGSHSNLAQTEAVQVEVHIEEHVDN